MASSPTRPHLPALFRDGLALTAIRAAEAAAEVQRAHAGSVSAETATDKGRADFVTAVDLEAQRAALDIIASSYPDDAILAEEEDPVHFAPGGPASDRGRSWIVDPLDGTTNYLHGHPAYCASVGVVEEGFPVAGAVLAPAMGLGFVGLQGAGAWMWSFPPIVAPGASGSAPGRRSTPRFGPSLGTEPESAGTPPSRIRTSATPRLDRALIATGFPFKRPLEIPGYLAELGRVLGATGGVRRDGAAALDLCLLARGTFDAFWEGHLSPWDVAGGLAILAEAGGQWSGPDGGAYDILRGGPLRAANGNPLLEALHPLLREGVAPGGGSGA